MTVRRRTTEALTPAYDVEIGRSECGCTWERRPERSTLVVPCIRHATALLRDRRAQRASRGA